MVSFKHRNPIHKFSFWSFSSVWGCLKSQRGSLFLMIYRWEKINTSNLTLQNQVREMCQHPLIQITSTLWIWCLTLEQTGAVDGDLVAYILQQHLHGGFQLHQFLHLHLQSSLIVFIRLLQIWNKTYLSRLSV